MTGTLIIIVAAAVLLAAVAFIFAMALKSARNEKDQALEMLKASHEANIASLKAGYEMTLSELRNGHQREISELKASNEKALAELKKSHEESMAQQLETVKAQVTAESEKMLKAREEELEKRAKQTFETITGGLDKNIKDMKEAFELHRKTHTETSQSLKENLENAVKHLREQTLSIGDKADSLADALRGKNKTQGNWGEIILDNLFTNEGMREGRDYLVPLVGLLYFMAQVQVSKGENDAPQLLRGHDRKARLVELQKQCRRSSSLILLPIGAKRLCFLQQCVKLIGIDRKALQLRQNALLYLIFDALLLRLVQNRTAAQSKQPTEQLFALLRRDGAKCGCVLCISAFHGQPLCFNALLLPRTDTGNRAQAQKDAHCHPDDSYHDFFAHGDFSFLSAIFCQKLFGFLCQKLLARSFRHLQELLWQVL